MQNYFCGWYFKCQSKRGTVALIPAIHRHGNEKFASVQLITEGGAWNISLPYGQFRKGKGKFKFTVGKSRFSAEGISLQLSSEGLSAHGDLRFGELSPIGYDIMGPFKYLPFMECRHSVMSMRHTVTGELDINGILYRFDGDMGYIEGDRGYSFPKEYAWTQCFFDGGSLMFSVADIPLGRFHFTGVIGIINWYGREYRLATYLGAKAVKIKNGEIVIKQGKSTFSAKLIERRSQPLRAPTNGMMSRTIHESASCRAEYRFEEDAKVLFEFESNTASFEYEYSSLY